ncbi:ABC transporter [Helicobacter magdeburgensis]|uniref:ABC transporter n=1 Tax=Helicobacter magdeburgensis TaxID=471858 RepID=A0A4U8SZI1_9HELI|nr:zinc ABC transporter substrate-binding protein [Helicobacter magdeburgensis]TLD92441.1 ABC transporter [Helicobacter magdeburgensis]
MKKIAYILLLLYLCGYAEPIKVLVSVLPQKQMLESIGKEYVEVEVLVPPSKSPEIYEPNIQQMKHIQNAEVFFGVGMPLESTWLKKFRSINPKLRYYNLAESHAHALDSHSQDSKHSNTHAHNPHIWLSLKESQAQVAFIAKILSTLQPTHKDFFTTQSTQLTKELEQIYIQAQNLFTKYATKSFLVYHPAFGDFARDFDLEELSIEKDGKEAKGRDLSQLITQIKQRQIKALFIQPQYSKSRVQSLANELKLEILTLNPLKSQWLNSFALYACQIALSLDENDPKLQECLEKHFSKERSK